MLWCYNNRCTREGKNETTTETGRVLQVDFFSHLIFSDDSFTSFELVSVITGSNSSRMVHQYVTLSDGLQCLPHSLKIVKEIPGNR